MNGFFNKRIPTLLGILAIVIGIGVTSFLTEQGVILIGQASPSDEPKNIQITNITDTSFTVSYTTDGAVFGSLNVGGNSSLGTTVLDDRDKSLTEHKSHMMTVRSLAPNTSYFFSITSGQDTYLNNGVLYSAKTGPTLETPTTEQRLTVLGKIIMPDGSGAEAVVYLNISGAQNVSSITKQDGSYSFQLNSIRSTNLSSYFDVPLNAVTKLLIFAGSLNSRASLTATQFSEVPTVTLSQNYDFTIGNSPISENEVATASAGQVFPSSTPSASTNSNPEILTPKKNQTFSDEKPLFKGTAQPNEDVQITIHSDGAISAKVVADSNGNWTYRPKTSLTPGNHTISITSRDKFGILKTITSQFSVFAAGSQVGDSATPSATLTPTVTPTPAAVVTVVPIASATPTITIMPTEAPIITPTAVLPPVGNSTGEAVGIFGAALLIIGALLFIFTRLSI